MRSWKPRFIVRCKFAGSVARTSKPQVPQWLAARRPAGAIIEEVCAFTHKAYTTTGTSPWDCMLEHMRPIYPGIALAHLDPSLWADIKRPRTPSASLVYFGPGRQNAHIGPHGRDIHNKSPIVR